MTNIEQPIGPKLEQAKARLAEALDLLEVNVREKFEVLMHDNHKEVAALLAQIDELSSKLNHSEKETQSLKSSLEKQLNSSTLGKIDRTISALEEILEVKNGGKISIGSIGGGKNGDN